MSVTVERALTRDQLERVRHKLAANGVVLKGDVGTFAAPTPIGDIAGSFRYRDGVLVVDVTKHRKLFGGAVKRGIESGIEEAIRS